MVILDLDFEFKLATSTFYLASVTTVLRGKDVATGSQWEKKPNWQNTGYSYCVTCYWYGEQVGREGPEVNRSPLVEMSPWVQFDSNAYNISGVPTIGTSPNGGFWSIKNINSKLMIHWFSRTLFSDDGWPRPRVFECVWSLYHLDTVIDERG